MKTLTIADIKRLTSETAPYFFSRNTLKFFGQKMSMFRVYKQKEANKYLIVCPMYNSQSKQIGETKRLFNPLTNVLENV